MLSDLLGLLKGFHCCSAKWDLCVTFPVCKDRITVHSDTEQWDTKISLDSSCFTHWMSVFHTVLSCFSHSSSLLKMAPVVLYTSMLPQRAHPLLLFWITSWSTRESCLLYFSSVLETGFKPPAPQEHASSQLTPRNLFWGKGSGMLIRYYSSCIRDENWVAKLLW